jgi:hypothetical protein
VDCEDDVALYIDESEIVIVVRFRSQPRNAVQRPENWTTVHAGLKIVR